MALSDERLRELAAGDAPGFVGGPHGPCESVEMARELLAIRERKAAVLVVKENPSMPVDMAQLSDESGMAIVTFMNLDEPEPSYAESEVEKALSSMLSSGLCDAVMRRLRGEGEAKLEPGECLGEACTREARTVGQHRYDCPASTLVLKVAP